MKVHYPKLYNMAHLSLNVFTASKGSNNYILLSTVWTCLTFSKLFGTQGAPSSDSLLNLLSSYLLHQGVYHDLFVCP